MSIKTEIDRLSAAKTAIKEAIEDKGVEVPNNETIDNYNAYIEKISTNSDSYGTCATAAATAAKVVNDIEGFELYEGVPIYVKMTYSNTVANPTLNVNGTGAKSIKRYGTTAPSTATTSSWLAGSVINFVYDGTYWQMVGWLNTTYSNVSFGHGYCGDETTASVTNTTVARTAKLPSLTLSTGGIVTVRFTKDVPANATLNIDYSAAGATATYRGAKPIIFNGSAITAGIIKAGDTATFQYSTYVVSTGQYILIGLVSGNSAQKYEHNVRIYGKDVDGFNFSVWFSFVNDVPKYSNWQDVIDYLDETWGDGERMATGVYNGNQIVGVYSAQGDVGLVIISKTSGAISFSYVEQGFDKFSLYDNVAVI